MRPVLDMFAYSPALWVRLSVVVGAVRRTYFFAPE